MNLYNLMDDTDEFASTQGTLIILGFGAPAYLLGLPLWPLIWVALERFLVLNWLKAWILIGDSGSSTLGCLMVVPIGLLRWKF